MGFIALDLSNATFNPDDASVRLSSKENNALSFSTDGSIDIMLGSTAGNETNFPGSSITGSVNTSIDVIRLNATVSRKVTGDPTVGNEGINIVDFFEEFQKHQT